MAIVLLWRMDRDRRSDGAAVPRGFLSFVRFVDNGVDLLLWPLRGPHACSAASPAPASADQSLRRAADYHGSGSRFGALAGLAHVPIADCPAKVLSANPPPSLVLSAG